MTNSIRKIVLFGGSGMVGQNIRNHPKAKLYQLLAPTRYEVNLGDWQAVWSCLKREQPDLVIHAAGKVGGIQANMNDLLGFLMENMHMAENIISNAKSCGVKKLINLGSSCMYPTNAVSPLREDQLMHGPPEPTNEGYALAKLFAMKMCQYSSPEYKTLIPSNLYGKWDKFDPYKSHMIPAAIRKVHEAQVSFDPDPGIEIWGDGKARREFMYAEDLADFIFFAIENWDKVPNVMNVGNGWDDSINNYYQTVRRVVGDKGHLYWNPSKPVGMQQRCLDVSEQDKLGWGPKTSLEEGIRKTYEFFLEMKDKGDGNK